jgi:hypothetical protein
VGQWEPMRLTKIHDAGEQCGCRRTLRTSIVRRPRLQVVRPTVSGRGDVELARGFHRAGVEAVLIVRKVPLAWENASCLGK